MNRLLILYPQIDLDKHAIIITYVRQYAKFTQAPVHNLAVERSVGFVNYELLRRGARQLVCTSSSQVKKAKAADLIDTCIAGSFRRYAKLTKKEPDYQKLFNNGLEGKLS